MFPFFPYTNFHELNADWILKTVKNLADAVAQLADNLAHVVRVTAQTFTQSEKAQARQNIGAISANDLPNVSDVVRYSPQDLTPTQQTRTRLNIGATSQADIELLLATKHYVKYDEQTLTEPQKAQARNNIGALGSGDIPPAANAVLYTEQNLTELQKAQARSNIEAAATSAIPDVSDVVRYSAQARTPEQKLRARTNIGAAYSEDVTDLADRVTDVENVAGIAVTYAAQTPTIAQKAQARSNIGAGSAVDVQTNANEIQTIYGELNNLRLFVNTVSGTTPTITPANNNIYICGTVTDLTVDTFPSTGMWSIVFVSGSTATSTDFPATLNGLDKFVPKTNTRYEINVLDGWAVVGSWEVSA